MSKWKYLAYDKNSKEYKLAEKLLKLEKKLEELNKAIDDLTEIDLELEAPLSPPEREELLRQREECF